MDDEDDLLVKAIFEVAAACAAAGLPLRYISISDIEWANVHLDPRGQLECMARSLHILVL